MTVVMERNVWRRDAVNIGPFSRAMRQFLMPGDYRKIRRGSETRGILE